MAISETIASVIYDVRGSLSTERVFKNAIDLLEQATVPKDLEDRLIICIEDIECLLTKIK
jgi:hypothetical protein